MSKPDNPPAFPRVGEGFDNPLYDTPGMSLREYYIGQVLANPSLCTGTAADWQLRLWFKDRGGVMPEEIAARQAISIADRVLAERERQP